MKAVKDMLGVLTPEQQVFAQDYAKLRVEVKMLKAALSTSQKQFAHLYSFITAILRQMEGYEIRFKRKDFEAYQVFKDSWEMLTEYDAETDEQVLRLRVKGGGGGRVGEASEPAGEAPPGGEAA
jgi:hypothetical protein